MKKISHDLGIKLTEIEMRKLDKRLQDIYTQAYVEAITEAEDWISKLVSLPFDAPKAKRIAFLNEVKRKSNMVENIAYKLGYAGNNAAELIKSTILDVYKLNYDFANYITCVDSGLMLNFAIYDMNQIAVLVNENKSPFTKIAYKNLGKNKLITERLNNHLAIATILGESQGKIIQRIKRITGQSVKQARRVAQTERTRVQSQGRLMSMSNASDMGITMDKQWGARMINTRDMHIESNLEIVPHDELFSNGLMYPGDPDGSAKNVINCHCVLKPMVRSASPLLAKHREKMKDISFNKYRQGRQ